MFKTFEFKLKVQPNPAYGKSRLDIRLARSHIFVSFTKERLLFHYKVFPKTIMHYPG